MSYEKRDALVELQRLGKRRTRRAVEIANEPEPDAISGALLLAIGSRETNMRNIQGGGYFDNDGKWVQTNVDAGMFQINRQYHAAWLKSVPGCKTGEWTTSFLVSDGGALPIGRVPGFTNACRKARSLLRYGRTYAMSKGISAEDALMCAVCGYNRGMGGSVNAFLRGEDPNSGTTGGNYGVDVLARRHKLRAARKELGW